MPSSPPPAQPAPRISRPPPPASLGLSRCRTTSNFGTPLNALAAPGGSYHPAGSNSRHQSLPGWIWGALQPGAPRNRLRSSNHSRPVAGMLRPWSYCVRSGDRWEPVHRLRSSPGAAALLRSANPTWSAAQVIAALQLFRGHHPDPARPGGQHFDSAHTQGATHAAYCRPVAALIARSNPSSALSRCAPAFSISSASPQFTSCSVRIRCASPRLRNIVMQLSRQAREACRYRRQASFWRSSFRAIAILASLLPSGESSIFAFPACFSPKGSLGSGNRFVAAPNSAANPPPTVAAAPRPPSETHSHQANCHDLVSIPPESA